MSAYRELEHELRARHFPSVSIARLQKLLAAESDFSAEMRGASERLSGRGALTNGLLDKQHKLGIQIQRLQAEEHRVEQVRGKIAEPKSRSEEREEEKTARHRRIEEIKSLKEQSTSLSDEIARIEKISDGAMAGLGAVREAMDGIAKWLSGSPQPVSMKTVSQNVRKNVLQIRAELLADIRAVEDASLTFSEIMAAAKKQVERLSDAARPRYSRLIDDGGEILWPNSFSIGYDISGREEAVSYAVQAWVDPDGLLKAIDRDVRAQHDEATALSAEERNGKLERLADKDLLLQHEIAAGIFANDFAWTELHGLVPEAVLGVEG